MKRVQYVERTGSFLFNLTLTWFFIIGAYGAMTGGRYPFVNQNTLVLVKWLIVIWPIIAIVIFVNRNWIRKVNWISKIRIPHTSFSLTNYRTSKLTFHKSHLHIQQSFLFWNLTSDDIKYEDINCIEMFLTDGPIVPFQIHYHIELHKAETKITIDLGGYTTVERVMILKTLKERNNKLKLNKRAKMYIAGYFLLRKRLKI